MWTLLNVMRFHHDAFSRNTKQSRITDTGTKACRLHRIFTMSVSSVYPLCLAKLERRGRAAAELDEVTCWLTGFSEDHLRAHHYSEGALTSLAPIRPVCGVRIVR